MSSELKIVDTKRLMTDFKKMRNDYESGLKDKKKLMKKYSYLNDSSESLFRMAFRDEKPDYNMLQMILNKIEERQQGLVSNREAEEQVGKMLGDKYITPVKKILDEKYPDIKPE